jgi:hypothetical protein
MNKEERIKRYGEAAYEKMLEQSRAWKKAHRAEANAYAKKYYEEHPEQVIANQHEANRKDGKRYDKKMRYMSTGIPGARCRIRCNHNKQYKPYKDIIAPESQIHHEWVPKTAEYRGIALVEKEPHQYGIVDVIQILDGEITLLTEEEVKRGKKEQ